MTQHKRNQLLHQQHKKSIYVSFMCNLSQGIKEAGIAEGKAVGMAEGKAEIITNMHNNGFTLEQIVVATGMDLSKIKDIITEKENLKNE